MTRSRKTQARTHTSCPQAKPELELQVWMLKQRLFLAIVEEERESLHYWPFNLKKGEKKKGDEKKASKEIWKKVEKGK